MNKAFLFAIAFLAGAAATNLLAAPIDTQPAVSGASDSDTHPPEVADAIHLFEAGDPQAAYKLLEKAAAKYPQFAPPRVMLANLYFSDNQKAPGLEQLELAAQQYPDDPEPHLIFGDIAMQERRISDAEVQYAAAEPLLKSFAGDAGRKAKLVAQQKLGLAAVMKARKQWPAAEKFLRQLIQQQPNNAAAHQRLAEALFVQSKMDDARAELQAALKADAALPPLSMMLAALYREAGDRDATQKSLKRALAEAPADIRPRLALGHWLFELGDIDGAAEQFLDAARIDPKSVEARFWCGVVARFQKQYVKAEHLLEALVEQYPSNAPARNQLALTLADENAPAKLSRAFDLATYNAERGPKNPEAIATLGWICYLQHKPDDAREYLGAVAGQGTVSRDTAYWLARLQFDLGKRDEAQQLLEQALSGRGPFAYREVAERLAAQIRTKSKSSGGSAEPPSTGPKKSGATESPSK